MYIPVSTSSLIFSNIPKKIKEYNHSNNNINDSITLTTLIFGLSIIIFLVLIIYKIHNVKIKQF